MALEWRSCRCAALREAPLSTSNVVCMFRKARKPSARNAELIQERRVLKGRLRTVNVAPCRKGNSSKNGHSSKIFHPSSGSNSVIAVASSVVVFPKSFSSNIPSWLMMKLITPELPYCAG